MYSLRSYSETEAFLWSKFFWAQLYNGMLFWGAKLEL